MPGTGIVKDPIIQEATPFEAIVQEEIGADDDASIVFVPDTAKTPIGGRSAASLPRVPESLSEKIALAS